MASPEDKTEISVAETLPDKGEAQPSSEELLPTSQETQPLTAEVQTNNEEKQANDVEVKSNDEQKQLVSAEEKLNNEGTQQIDEEMRPDSRGTEPNDEEVQPNNGGAQSRTEETQPDTTESQKNNEETQPIDAEMLPKNEPQPIDAEILPKNEAQPIDGGMQPENEEAQPLDAEALPKNEDAQLTDAEVIANEEIQPNNEEMQPKKEETRPVDAKVRPDNGETQTIDAEVLGDNENTNSFDAKPQLESKERQEINAEAQLVGRESQVINAEEQPKNEEAQPIHAEEQLNNEERPLMETEMQPKIGETQPVEAQMQPDGETRPVDSEVHPDNEHAEPISAEIQPSSEETQPINAEMLQKDEGTGPISGGMQPHSKDMQHYDVGMQQSYEETQPSGAEMLPNKGEMQTFNAGMHQDDGEMQPLDVGMQQDDQPLAVDMQTDDGVQQFNAEMHPHVGEMQPFDADMHTHGGDMESFDAEIEMHNGQIQLYDTEMHPNNGQIQPYEPETRPEEAEMQPNKRRKKKSMVWEHFIIETVSPGCRRARCKQCKQSFAYSTGSKVAGTSHLKRHIAKGTCAALLHKQENNQLSPYTTPSKTAGSVSASGSRKRRYRTSSSPYVPFDQDRCRQEIARMIIMHDYPLHMVEHVGFVSFVRNLQPQFDLGSFNTVQGDCIATYLTEKQNIMRLIEGIPGRVCLTVDVWSSKQTLGYVFLTGHFIDSDWKMHRRVLNVVMESCPESDTALGHAISVCTSDWSLESKLLSITFSQPLSEAGLENLRAHLSVQNPLILNGQLLVGNCIACTLSCMAEGVLGAGEEVIKKIRESVKYVKTSESHEEKFLELKQQLQVPSEKSLSFDDQTKWNTTYQMLVAASELKEVFSCLDTSDPDYKKAPSMEDWKQVETLCTHLKLLYDAANSLTSAVNPVTVTCFQEVWKIQSELGRAASSEDPFISNLTKPLHERINKYWKDCSLVLAMAVVMDPRFKMKLVEFTFSKLYGEDAPTYINIVDDGIHELFREYVALPLPLTPTYAEEGHAGYNVRTDDQGGMVLSDHGLTDFDVYIMETTSQQMKSELDRYLEESLVPRMQEIDVLDWWKQNRLRYPTLSKMARDILTIPVCSVPADSVFDTVTKEMDGYRSSLRPVTVEALICAKDWLQYSQAEVSNALVKMEY